MSFMTRYRRYIATNGSYTSGVASLTVPGGPSTELISEAEWLIPRHIRPSEFVGKRKLT